MKVLLKAGRVGPGLLASTVIVALLVGPALPVGVRQATFFGGALVLALLVAGVAESWAVRVLFGARRLTDLERTGLAPVITELCGLELGPPAVRLHLSRRPGAPAAVAHGRRSVVVSRELAYGVLGGRLPNDEAVAVLAHAALVARAGLSRQDPAIAFRSTPWRLLAGLSQPLHGLLGIGWQARPIVFGVAIWQSLTTGPPGGDSTRPAGLPGWVAAVTLTLILAMTYLAPRCATSWQTHVIAAGDRRWWLVVSARRWPPSCTDIPRRRRSSRDHNCWTPSSRTAVCCARCAPDSSAGTRDAHTADASHPPGLMPLDTRAHALRLAHGGVVRSARGAAQPSSPRPPIPLSPARSHPAARARDQRPPA